MEREHALTPAELAEVAALFRDPRSTCEDADLRRFHVDVDNLPACNHIVRAKYWCVTVPRRFAGGPANWYRFNRCLLEQNVLDEGEAGLQMCCADVFFHQLLQTVLACRQGPGIEASALVKDAFLHAFVQRLAGPPYHIGLDRVLAARPPLKQPPVLGLALTLECRREPLPESPGYSEAFIRIVRIGAISLPPCHECPDAGSAAEPESTPDGAAPSQCARVSAPALAVLIAALGRYEPDIVDLIADFVWVARQTVNTAPFPLRRPQDNGVTHDLPPGWKISVSLVKHLYGEHFDPNTATALDPETGFSSGEFRVPMTRVSSQKVTAVKRISLSGVAIDPSGIQHRFTVHQGIPKLGKCDKLLGSRVLFETLGGFPDLSVRFANPDMRSPPQFGFFADRVARSIKGEFGLFCNRTIAVVDHQSGRFWGLSWYTSD
eukprot:m.74820 g.74820  ORF g.74820 m.74820 type:complete len:434 (+) comp10345_c0_seq1:95-1396(+)